jgi:hypothetical protein
MRTLNARGVVINRRGVKGNLCTYISSRDIDLGYTNDCDEQKVKRERKTPKAANPQERERERGNKRKTG